MHIAPTFFSRYSRLLCFLAMLLLPATLYGTLVALQSLENDVVDWLPEEFEETETLLWFLDRFGSDSILVASWPGCTVDDSRLDDFQVALWNVRVPGGETAVDRAFKHVFTGRDLLQQLTSAPLDLPPPAALSRMRGWLVGPDGRTTCAILFFTEAGWEARHQAIAEVRWAAKSAGVGEGELRLGGPAADSVAIDQVSERWLVPLAGCSGLVGLAIGWWCLGRLSYVVAAGICAAMCWSLALAILPVCGVNLDSVLITMPALVYVLGISSAVHLTGYFEMSLQRGAAPSAPGRALRIGWAPCLAATITTAAGLGSLAISEIVPVRRFGFFSAVAVVLSVVILFSFWPALIFLLRRLGRPATAETPRLLPAERGNAASHHGRWWLPLFQYTTRRWYVVVPVVLTAMVLLGAGLTKIRTSVGLADLFAQRCDIMRDYAWLEEHIGPLVPVETVVRFEQPDRDEPNAFLERLQFVERLRRHIEQLENVSGTVAASSFVPSAPSGGGIRQVIRRRLLARQLQEQRPKLIKSQFLYDEQQPGQPAEEMWRISGRVPALNGPSYPPFLAHFERDVRQFIADDPVAQKLHASVTVCGGVFVAAMAQDQLLRDLGNSFLLAFGLIAMAMILLTRSLSTGLLSMLPNVFPALVIFGIMGWFNVGVDIGAMMTASVALGIAVDDTSHFLSWFQRGRRQGLSQRASVRLAYRSCATAMLQTTLICGLGLLPFAASPFLPVSRFAWLMAGLLAAALLGDLLLLPALLASPAGRLLKTPQQGHIPEPHKVVRTPTAA